MEHPPREYPLFAACGLNCGLCPRHHTDGASRCPGCGGPGFAAVHPPCGVLSCSRRQNAEYCAHSGEYPCQKLAGVGLYDSFITHQNQLANLQKMKEAGTDAYRAELEEKITLLRQLLAGFDDGRHKSFFCLVVNLLPLPDVRYAAERLAAATPPDAAPKEKAAAAEQLLRQAAEQRGIALQLRKKPKG